MYCSNCGTKLDKSYKYCPKCGIKVLNIDDGDSLYEDIKEYIISENKATITMIRTKFNLTYKNASMYMKKLEEEGIVGPSNGSKPRKILVSDYSAKKSVKDTINTFMDTPDSTDEFDEKDIKDNTFLAILSYLSILVVIPYFGSNNSKYVRYHAIQGMNLLLFWGIYTIMNNILSNIKVTELVVNFDGIRGSKLVTPIWVTLPLGLVQAMLIALSIIGIVYVLQGKAKELPIIGKLKIIK